MAVIGVIPAAGHASRLQPLDVSKEVLPVGGRPVMDYLVERMRAAPCTEVRVVTRPDKQDVVANAARHGATVIEASPSTLAESVLTAMRGLAGDDVALLGFPDSIWEPIDGFTRVIDLLEAGWSVGLGLFRAKDLRRYEPVVLEDSGRVLGIEFKPENPSSSWIWGCAAATVRALRGLEGEDEPGVYFDSLSRQGRVGGVRLSDTYVDIGTPAGLREAVEGPPA